jgi:hypothetical protein
MWNFQRHLVKQACLYPRRRRSSAAAEAEGRLWASGPFIEEGVLVGDGLTILSTSTIDEARQAMEDGPPLIKRGLRTFELRKWELREGRIDIPLHASVSRYSL